MSEKMIKRQQAGLIRWAKTSRWDSADLAGACSGDKFIVSRAGEAYDLRNQDPNRKFRFTSFRRMIARGIRGVGDPGGRQPFFNDTCRPGLQRTIARTGSAQGARGIDCRPHFTHCNWHWCHRKSASVRKRWRIRSVHESHVYSPVFVHNGTLL